MICYVPETLQDALCDCAEERNTRYDQNSLIGAPIFAPNGRSLVLAALSPMSYIIDMYKILRTLQFDEWLEKLRDPVASAAINIRIERARLGNLGNWKAVGEGVCEMKIDVGQGYRAYFVQRGTVIIVLLCGGNKSTQSKDIKLARKLASELED
jgi:putative addiction module killer protein